MFIDYDDCKLWFIIMTIIIIIIITAMVEIRWRMIMESVNITCKLPFACECICHQYMYCIWVDICHQYMYGMWVYICQYIFVSIYFGVYICEYIVLTMYLWEYILHVSTWKASLSSPKVNIRIGRWQNKDFPDNIITTKIKPFAQIPIRWVPSMLDGAISTRRAWPWCKLSLHIDK